MPVGLTRPSSDIEPVVGIQFGIFSPDEIERRSVVEVTNAGTYDGNEPRIGGLFDPRMGVLDNGKTCRSCGQTNHSCPGHFGHFKLARPVYFIQFFETIKSILNCVCIKCSKLLIDKELHKDIPRRRGEARWRATLAACANITRCGQQTEDGCGARQPDRYVRESIATIVAEWNAIEGPGATGESATEAPKMQRQRLEVEQVLRLLRRITDEDVDFMGFSRYFCRPDWMICSVMPIPPPQVRPSVIQDNNQRSEDDLTHKLVEIIMTNHRLQDKMNNNANKSQIEDEHTVLQYHVATLVDNQIPGVAPSAQRSGRPLKSVMQRLGSKEGRIRYNIQGKRVEFSARSVITPDPNISIGELGVPMKIAMNLTFPEKVTPYNKEQMYRLVQNGPDRFPGAKTIVRADGRMISLKHVNTKEIVLHTGDVVNRHLNDGDIVLFNRQPTLHRMSMMGHRVRVLPYNTFRLNVSVTAPYNADFDGDEMNAHIPQSYEAATELAEIAAVPHQIVTPRHAKPVIGIVQDTLVGSYRITRPGVAFNRREYMNMMMWNKRFEGKVPTGKAPADVGPARYTGQQILSELMPPINLEMGNDSYKDDKRQENMVKIREGEVVQGIFDKGIFSKPSKGIIHTTFKDYGSTDTVNFIDTMQNTVEQFLVYNGFSVGISDLIADEETRKQMEEVIKKRKTAVENILLQIHMDLFDNNTGKTNQQEFEDKVFVELNKATEEAGKSGLGSLADENRLIAMVKAGSKGSNINIAQMMACVGQQAPEGKRIPYGFTDRTLPHYKKYDDGAEARGFVESSFIKGLTPQEFFFHAMSGREGLIDTAVKTADTGYIQRKLVKAMEDLVVQYDGTVRDSRGNIFQFYYGEDGINATKIESVGLGISKLSEEEIKKTYGMEGAELSAILEEGTLRGEDAAAIQQFVETVLEDRRMLVEDIQKFKQDTALFASVNVERILTNVATAFRLEAEGKTDLTPLYVLQGIERLIRKTQQYHKLWAAVLRFYLAPHRLIVKERFTRRAFDAACEMILVKNYQSWVQPGEQVGIIAAQSIGEPSTQMSAHKDTWVHVQAADGAHFCGKIADFVDRLLEQNPEAVKAVPGHTDSVVMDLSAGAYSIIGVSTDEKTSWRPISQISRHPANGGLVKVVTKSGRTTTATLSHSFLKRTAKGVAPILGSELEVGMRIPVATYLPEMPAAATGRDGFVLTTDFGWVCGIYLADGSVHGNQVRITKAATEVEEAIRAVGATYGWEITAKDYQTEQGLLRETLITSAPLKNFLQEHFGVGSAKAVGPAVFSMCREFQQGVVGGYFDGDGNVNPDRQQIRAGSRSQELIRSMNRLLGYCGYFGVMNEETTVNLPGKVMYTVNILKKYAARFQAEIGFRIPEKAAGLDEIVAYCARENKHDTKELYDKIPEVGDLVAEVGKALDIPGHSRMYGRWTKKESIGRLTLASYVDTFKARAGKSDVATAEIARLEAAVRADVLWDEITELVYLPDPKEFVYDFTVPGNDSFMVDDMILVHNTLNTFHLAGVAAKSNVTRGVPRLNELLKVTQNPKAISLTVPLKPEFRGNKEKAREVAQDLELTLLRDITVKTAIYFDPSDETSVVEEDRDLLKFYHLFEDAQAAEEDAPDVVDEGAEERPAKWSGWLLRFELDREHMFRKNISMDDVAFVLRWRFGAQLNLVYSDYNSQKLIMRMRLPDLMKGGLDDLANLKKFQTRILNGIVFRGVPGIKSVSFREDKDMLELKDGKYEQVTQYVLDTDGSNFLAVMRHPYVDAKRLSSSHVHDIYEVLGIEATRQVLLNEITTLFEEAGVNNRHLGLLCDVMTNSGRLMAADRHGINKTDIGPLAKASFEETERILLGAALYGETDPVTGVSANIMMGQPIRGGTGFFQVLLDEGAFLRLQEGLPPAEGYDDEELEEPTQEQIDQELYEDENDLCSSARLRMNVAMPTAPALLEEEDVELAILDAEE
jgi:DNA-directed RNA polymerase beta' subunit